MRQANKIDDAITAFRNAIEINADNFDANHSLAAVMARRGELTEAVGLARRSTELRPSNATAQVTYGELLRRIDDRSGAMEAANRALEIVPNYEKALNLRGLLLREQGKYEGAISLFETGLRARPSSDANRLNLAASFTAVGRYDEAAKLFEEYLLMNPNKPTPYLGLGKVNRLQEKFWVSERRLLDGLKLFPLFRALHYELGLTFIRMERLDEADEHLAKAANGKKPLPTANIAYGKFLLQTGRLAEAAAQFKAALDHRPADEAARDGLAQALGEVPINVKWHDDMAFAALNSENADDSSG